MTPELTQAIENAYREFARYRLRGVIAVCKCNVCVDDKTERELVTLPLRSMTSSLVAEYTNSAHGFDDRAADELRYFLPRYFELIALDDVPSQIGIETCLDRLYDAHYRDTWPKSEVEAIEAFFAALLRSHLAVPPEIDPTGFPVFAGDAVEDMLCMVARAGGDIASLLEIWDADVNRAATLHVANVIAKTDWRKKRLENTFWHGTSRTKETEPSMKRTMAWMLTPEMRERLENACLVEKDEAAAALLSHAESLAMGAIMKGIDDQLRQ